MEIKAKKGKEKAPQLWRQHGALNPTATNEVVMNNQSPELAMNTSNVSQNAAQKPVLLKGKRLTWTELSTLFISRKAQLMASESWLGSKQ